MKDSNEQQNHKLLQQIHTIIYKSFKYGEFEGKRNGRYFTENRFKEFISHIPQLQIKEIWDYS